MIISSLANYYGRLLENPASGVAKPGWCERQVKFMLELSPDGQLKSVIPCGDGKHGVSKIVPEQEKRSSGIKANFLCDTSSYLLGIDAKGKPERAIQCFEASKQLHEALLSGVDSPMAAAIVNYFNLWNPGQILDNPIPGFSEEVLEGGNLTFCLEDGTTWKEACNEPSIKRVCGERAQNDEGQSEMVSLVTGRREPIARLHPAIKGVVGAQSMGASLVGFNCEAFESYGHAKEQGRNAPVDVKSTQAYTTALNYLLAHRGHRGRFGDTTVVFWSSSQTADQGNCSVLSLALGFSIFESKESESEATSNLKAALERLQAGKPVDIEGVSFGDEFYLLGLAPNAARLSVRFFLRDSFGEVMRHVADHYRITDVCHAAFDPPIATPYRLLDSLENPNAKDPVISSQLSAPLMRSILQGARYPEALFQNALLRVRATKTVKREHAAIIRAYLIRNARMEEKEITVDVNPSNENEAYVLGRTFAVLEQIQEAANGKATIADRYLNAACSTPATTFPVLLKLSVAHLSKVSRDTPGRGVYLEKALGELMEMQQTSFPKRLSLIDQGSFLLGYYQQKQARYKKNDEQEA